MGLGLIYLDCTRKTVRRQLSLNWICLSVYSSDGLFDGLDRPIMFMLRLFLGGLTERKGGKCDTERLVAQYVIIEADCVHLVLSCR